ncbi:MAG: glycosyl transferase [Muribaculaceae bacterium]|nr:glycosyl transferase [Muribaculaceae bacterium]
MIPKIIHYCWFGRKDKPESFRNYLATWKKCLPDYRIMEWNEDNFDVNCCVYSREAYGTHNLAHVSDVCRIYALSTYGGIYLDTDVEVCKPFNQLLENKAFLGMESDRVGTCVIGSEPGLPWLKAVMNYYSTTHFINIWGHCVRTPNTAILTFRILPSLPKQDWPKIYPIGYFCDLNDRSTVTDTTYSIHHYHATWRKRKTLATRVKALALGLKVRYL